MATAPTVNEQIAAETARKSAVFQTMTQRQLRTIANSSTTAGRWSWLEINLASATLKARDEANRLRALNNSFTVDQLDQHDPDALFEYLYDDGVAWGVGTADEARAQAAFANAPVDTLRYRRIA
jgi:hypothetical protein